MILLISHPVLLILELMLMLFNLTGRDVVFVFSLTIETLLVVSMVDLSDLFIIFMFWGPLGLNLPTRHMGSVFLGLLKEVIEGSLFLNGRKHIFVYFGWGY